MPSSHTSLLKSYVSLVEFLGNAIGPHCEVVLHDVTNLEKSIIAIKNNHISKRNVGGSITDLVLKILKNKEYLQHDYLMNYSGKTQSGKILRSSTFFIKNQEETVIGMLCFNMDVSQMVEARNVLDHLINGVPGMPLSGLQLDGKELEDDSVPTEDFHTSIENLTSGIIVKTLTEFSIAPERMSADEKTAIVKKLNDQGVFLIKGAVAEVAVHLKTSEATVYRYLKQVERHTNEMPL